MLFPTDADSNVLDSSVHRVPPMDNSGRSEQSAPQDTDSAYYDSGYNPSTAVYRDFRTQIEHSLAQFNIETAVFLAEMYYTECLGLATASMNRLQAAYLYALALYMAGRHATAAEIAERYKSRHVALAYVYGRARLALASGEENACLYLAMHLEECGKNERRDREWFYNMPTLATLHCLVGRLYRRTDNIKTSISHHLEALKLEPCLWESYTELCAMKAVVNIKALFNYEQGLESTGGEKDTSAGALRNDLTRQLNNSNGFLQTQRSERQQQQRDSEDKVRSSDSRLTLSGSLSPFRTMANKGKPGSAGGIDTFQQPNDPVAPYGSTKRAGSNTSSLLLNQHTQNPLFSDSSMANQGKLYRPRSSNDAAAYAPSAEQPTISSLAKKSGGNSTSVPIIVKNRILTTPPPKMQGDQRTTFKTPRNMSSMGTNTTRKLMMSQNSTSAVSSLGMVSSRQNRTLADAQASSLSQEFKNLLYNFFKILKTSSQYNSYNAIRVMNCNLPTHILNNMPWCQAQLAKLHFEIVNYDMALIYFTNLRRIQPTRLKDLEIYSTLLWHLGDKVKLSNLSSELVNTFPEEAQTWCVVGNYFSLLKDHEEAIKSFEKATKINPYFSYAYTLQGHEYASNESFDIAKEFYMKALACDPQHYNAYYGMGSCASQLGKFEEALLYFEKARVINPVNVVLICCCGTELEKLYHNEMALKYYELACKLDPRSILAKYRRAELLFTMNRYSVALGQFEELIKLDSENPNLHFMLGKILETLGRKKDAIREYTIALHLDPKGNQFVIEALENCHMQE